MKNVSYHKLYDILKQRQNEVNEIRAERLAHAANPLALIAQQQPAYHPQSNPTHYTQSSSNRSPAATRNRGKAIANSPSPTFDSKPEVDTDDDKSSKEKEINKLMALTLHVDNTPRSNRGTGDDEPDNQELKAHYSFMAQIQEVSPNATDNSGPIFDIKPVQKLVEIIMFIVDSGCSKHMTEISSS
ncbi:hypothetical protein Tco_0920791 [Tanacetum coccineum]